jgi:DEAD/DEAH box helicase domain-containing protein
MHNFVEYLKTTTLRSARVVHHHFVPSRAAIFAELEPPLSPPLKDALTSLSISRLYQHQADAISRFRNGKNVVIATPTSSGKSLIYNLAFVELMSQEADGHGLYLFPLKALAQDQYQAFLSLNQALPADLRLEGAIYDGDTPPSQRRRIKEKLPHLIISNPDMLHLGFLPYHQQWEEFFRGLRLVVVDEVHTYRGIFGSHVVQVFRRLQRICRLYGSQPRYIMSSATISNAGDFAGRLTGMTFEPVEENGAGQSGQHFFFVNPESSATTIASRLFIQAVQRGLKTIAFTQARKITEILHMNVAQAAPGLASKVSSYRAGFLAGERRDIERGLASGAVAGVISTSALEMGIDIGGLDVCILVGYPGTIINTWQRSGRVGRGGGESVVILIGQPDALDQYFMRYPQDFFQRPFEAAVVDPDNLEVLDGHLSCAAAEVPLKETDDLYGRGGILAARAPILEARGDLLRSAEGDVWYASRKNPQRLVDIRSVGQGYTILNESSKKVVGKNDGIRAFKECHPGAIYLHRGQQHLVTRLDLKRCNAFVKPTKARYYTRALSEKETEILEVERSRPVANFVARLGRLRVTEQVVGYEKRNLFSGERLDSLPLDLPPLTFETVGLWVEIEGLIQEMVRQRRFHFMGGIHALEHAVISMFPLFAMCDRNDVGGIAIPRHPQLQKSAVFIYDGYPGGVGLAVRGFEMIEALLQKSGELIASCPCDLGCPSCIHSPKCGSGNKPLDKNAALFLIQALLGEVQLKVEVEDQPRRPIRMEEEDLIPSASGEPALAFFDIETRRLADEVGGWGNIHLMRLAVAALYDQSTDGFSVFTEEQVEDLINHLQRFDLVVGFNVKRFDYRVLGAYSPLDFGKIPTFDILEDIHKRLGFRLSLAHLAEQTLGRPKSGDGIQAVQWFREGNLDAVISYCKDDVVITRELFKFGLSHGYLLYQTKQGKAVRLPVEWNLSDLLREAGREA